MKNKTVGKNSTLKCLKRQINNKGGENND